MNYVVIYYVRGKLQLEAGFPTYYGATICQKEHGGYIFKEVTE